MTTPKKTHGGSRPGAGRPPSPPVLSDTPGNDDPLKFLQSAMNDAGLDMRVRVDCAKALMGYMHAKPTELGKKGAAQQAAAKVAGGSKFAPSRPPPLRAV